MSQKLCISCTFYRYNKPSSSPTDDYIPEHGCVYHVSPVTGKEELREAEAMRSRTFVVDSCEPEGKFYKERKLA